MPRRTASAGVGWIELGELTTSSGHVQTDRFDRGRHEPFVVLGRRAGHGRSTDDRAAGIDHHHAAADARIMIPIRPEMRSLNVAVSAAMALGEAIRQIEAGVSRSA